MSRLYAVEARLSVTGMNSDDRLRVQARQVRDVAAAVLAALILGGPPGATGAARGPAASRSPSPHDGWAKAVARDLRAHAGACLVIAGDGQPPDVHAMAHAMNVALGNVGTTVTYGASPVFEAGEPTHGLDGLVAALDSGDVHTLLIVGGDPVYTAAADLDLARRLRAVPTTAFVGAYDNATARACAWFAPESHFLEAWGDATAFDGTASIAQPLIAPLVDGKTAGQVLAALLGRADVSAHDLVRESWRRKGADSDGSWRKALVHGVLEGDSPAGRD